MKNRNKNISWKNNNNYPVKAYVITQKKQEEKNHLSGNPYIPKALRNRNIPKQNPDKNNNLNNKINNRKEIINYLKNNNQPLCNIFKNDKTIYNKLGSVISNINRSNNNSLPLTEKINKYKEGSIGLINIGNTCYLNSALQNLKNVYHLTYYLLYNYRDYDEHGFTYKYCKLIANLINQGSRQCFEPKEFFNKLSEYAPIFRFGHQNDSNLSILYILNFLEKETKKYTKYKILQDIKLSYLNPLEKEKFYSFLKKIFERRNSCIIDFFYGFQKDMYKCNICPHNIFNFQGFSVLNLSIMKQNNESIKSLQEAIQYYQKEQIHKKEKNFVCQKCNNYNISTQSIIISYPKNLIINFKRIGEQHFYNHNVKIDEFMKIQTDKYLYEYELIGFIKHMGGAYSGHNIAICKNFFDEKWYVYDDSRVQRIDNTNYINDDYSVNTTDGFLFFYKQKDNIISDNEKDLIKKKSEEIRK